MAGGPYGRTQATRSRFPEHCDIIRCHSAGSKANSKTKLRGTSGPMAMACVAHEMLSSCRSAERASIPCGRSCRANAFTRPPPFLRTAGRPSRSRLPRHAWSRCAGGKPNSDRTIRAPDHVLLLGKAAQTRKRPPRLLRYPSVATATGSEFVEDACGRREAREVETRGGRRMMSIVAVPIPN